MNDGCRNKKRQRVSSFSRRRGATLVLCSIFLIVLLGMTAFSFDLAYMGLVKTELRISSDAAAKAGTSALVQGLSSTAAVNATIAAAAANKVAGRPLLLTSNDISLGQTQLQSDGTWQFVAGLTPLQAVQVSSSMSSSNANGAVKLFFGPMLGTSYYSPSNVAVASAYACEVCLVIDRSHSMCFDLSGTTWYYPPPYYSDWYDAIQSPPVSGSRWAQLVPSINTFCNIMSTANSPPRVALVTWASDIGTNTSEYAITGQTSVGVTTDVQLTNNYASISSSIQSRNTHVMLGGTNMGSGIDQGISILTSSNAKAYAKKVMILMTDGQWNIGNDPLASAQNAAAQNITIHCVCFLQNADQTTCQKIASITGGKFYYASDGPSLQAAFTNLAISLPIALTK